MVVVNCAVDVMVHFLVENGPLLLPVNNMPIIKRDPTFLKKKFASTNATNIVKITNI